LTERFTAQAVYLIPVLASLLFGLACASSLLPQSFAPIPVTPFPENSPSGPFGNALYFVILVAVSATVFYILLKRKSQKIIMVLIGFALTTAALLLSLVYLSAVFAYVPSLEFLVIPLSIVLAILFDLAVFRWSGKASNAAVVCLGGALGVFFGFFIPLWSALLILAFLAVYDVIAVYYGPVGKIAQSGLDQLKGLSYSFKEIQMGLGDLVFYSMLSGTMLFNFGWIPCSISIVGILAGSFLTLLILEKKSIFPGLPLPVLLGLAGGLLASLI
jgi:presenilin-like A22 family membrane protease